jgi:hypothetical protein
VLKIILRDKKKYSPQKSGKKANNMDLIETQVNLNIAAGYESHGWDMVLVESVVNKSNRP